MFKEKLQMILTKNELARLKITESLEKEARVVVDVHNMRCYQAKRLINNIINVINSNFHLIIIHGYNHGTAIKDMLANNFNNEHISYKYSNPCNYGVTHMTIAA